eukprot:889516-Pleurochrysis_carterae.AAC.2
MRCADLSPTPLALTLTVFAGGALEADCGEQGAARALGRASPRGARPGGPRAAGANARFWPLKGLGSFHAIERCARVESVRGAVSAGAARAR